jgi:hypothetical protein
VDPTRPDQPHDTPVYVRPAPVQRHVGVRIGTTLFVLVLFLQLGLWFRANQGPVAAFGLVLGVPASIGAIGLLHWAWKKHPF